MIENDATKQFKTTKTTGKNYRKQPNKGGREGENTSLAVEFDLGVKHWITGF